MLYLFLQTLETDQEKVFSRTNNMLTKNDLRAIKQLVDETINSALKDRPTKNDLVGLAKGIEIDELKIEFRDRLERWKHELYNKIDPNSQQS